MPDLDFRCANCGKALSATGPDAGLFITCPDCGRETSSIQRESRAKPRIVGIEVKLLCPACDSRLGIDARYGGLAGECPRCRVPLTIPTFSAADFVHFGVVSALEGPSRSALTSAEIDFLSAPPETVPAG